MDLLASDCSSGVESVAMAVQRFRSEVDRTRRVLGAIFVVLALFLIQWVVRVEIAARRVTVAALVYLALFGGLFYLGLRLLRPKDLFEIDAERRTYTVIRNGTKAGAGPLDDLGPLEVQRRVYRSGLGNNSNDRRTPSIHYVVNAAVHGQIELCTVRSAGKARRRMESLARAWGVPCRSLGGTVRRPDQLDMPLHERLRDDAEARKEAPLPAESGIRIEPLSLGYAMHSTLRSWASLRSVGLFLCVALFVFARTSPSTFLAELREMDDLYRQVLLAGSGVVILIFLVLIGQAVRDTFFPGTVRVTDRGVSYRWSRMAFREIEELIGTHPIELIGDRRTLKLGETFCSPGATKAVAHELQRLIIEVAEANPHARS
jgi:hypothetical protein